METIKLHLIPLNLIPFMKDQAQTSPKNDQLLNNAVRNHFKLTQDFKLKKKLEKVLCYFHCLYR